MKTGELQYSMEGVLKTKEKAVIEAMNNIQ